MAAATNQRGNPVGSYCAVEKDAGRDEGDPKPPPETSSIVRIGSDPPVLIHRTAGHAQSSNRTDTYRLHMRCVENQKQIVRLKTNQVAQSRDASTDGVVLNEEKKNKRFLPFEVSSRELLADYFMPKRIKSGNEEVAVQASRIELQSGRGRS